MPACWLRPLTLTLRLGQVREEGAWAWVTEAQEPQGNGCPGTLVLPPASAWAQAQPGHGARHARVEESWADAGPAPGREGRGAVSSPTADGRTRRRGHAASAPGRGLPEAAAGPEPLARPSRPIGSGVSPADAAPRASPPCARSAVSSSLHCPAPPRSRPSPSSQPFTPPNRRGRTQEGPALCGAPCKASALPTAAPGGSEAAWQPAGTRLRSTPPCGRGQ